MSFSNIVTTLKNERAQATLNHEEFLDQIDIMINSAESLASNSGSNENGKSHQTPPLKKIKIEDIYSVLRKNGTLHVNEICEIMSKKRGEPVSKTSIAMLISHYFRKFKKKAQIKQTEKSTFCIK